ncbi:MAG: hypothetical protein F4Z07_12215 [Dehalococcoidia bacterium]|nr:hypothetical protein [Dehalococcoidia bacterium]
MSERAAGSIYDLGYRRYEGRRLGRRNAVLSLYVHGLRAAFGLGRRTRSKIFPMGLGVVAALPAIGYLMAAAFIDIDISDVIRAEDYFSSIFFFPPSALMLFVAAVAPELLGRDQRHATLPLYFSRALSREDYALARYASMATALLALTLLPQAILFLGNALVVDSFGGYFQDEWGQIGPIIGSSLLISLFFAAIGMVISAQTGRRAFATIGVIAPFVFLPVISLILVGTVENIVGRLGIFLNPFFVIDGFTYWFFDSAPNFGEGGTLTTADFAGGWYFFFALVVTALGIGLLLRHYGRRSL